MSKVTDSIEVVLYVFICAATGYLIATAFMDSIALGVIVAIIGVIIVGKTSKPSFTKSKSSSTKNISSTTYGLGTNTTKSIEPGYFQQISKVVDDLIFEYDFACNLSEFAQQIEDEGFDLNINGKPLTTSKEKIRLMFWVDIVRCYRGLGIPCDSVNKSSYGLYAFIEYTFRGVRYRYDDYLELYDQNFHSLSETIIQGMADPHNEMPDKDDDFLIAYVYGKLDDSLRQRYIVRLYRFASIIAKADNVVTEKEAAWLSSIMQMKSNGVNMVISGEEQEEHVKTYSEDFEWDRDSWEQKEKITQEVSHQAELQKLIGLGSVKTEVAELTNFIRIQNARSQKGLKASPITYHCVFTGNPGTGKTTVARILANIYKELGVVSKGHLVETDRSGLVGEYVGQTAVKTNKVIDHALGGILFIDEAYSLLGGGEEDYGKEAVATLLKRMEDDRKRLVVILAGYTNEMKAFIDSNPGLQSRFSRYIEFPDYHADELYQIFLKQLKEFDYTITPDAAAALKSYFGEAVAHKDANFGNARFVRNVFERTLQRQANRLSTEVNLTSAKLAEITKEDLPEEF